MNDRMLRDHLLALLDGKNAHLTFDEAVADMPPELQGVRAGKAPHSAWRLLEHLRIAQWDILEFSRNPRHVSPEFPLGYWPATDAPPDQRAWDRSVQAFRADLQAMKALVADPSTDLFAEFRTGMGRRSCGKLYWSWTITRTTSVSLSCCGRAGRLA